MGTTCLACRVLEKTWPAKDPCRPQNYKNFSPQFCYCPEITNQIGKQVAALRTSAGYHCGDLVLVIEMQDNAHVQALVTRVDDGPYANNAFIDLHQTVFPNLVKFGTIPVCLFNQTGNDSRVTTCRF